MTDAPAQTAPAPDRIAVPVDALVSYHYLRADDRMRRIVGEPDADGLAAEGRLFRLIADSGAFSAYRQGAVIELDEYAAWLHRWRPHLFWSASLDVFGDPVRSLANWKALRDTHGLHTVPTIHIGTDVTWLDVYADEGVDFVGLGGMVGQPRPAQLRFLVHCLRRARDRYPSMRFHAWGTATHDMLGKLPLYSVDSSGLIGNAFRRGIANVWDDRARTVRHVPLDGRDPWMYRALLVDQYKMNPGDILRSSGSNRASLIALCTESLQRRAAHYQRIHAVTAPAYGITGHAPVGPRLHMAEANPRDYALLRTTMIERASL